MYAKGLSLQEIGRFQDHGGFDGVMLGNHGLSYHFEFTYCRAHPVAPSPTPEDLIIIYLPELEDWRRTCSLMLDTGFVEVSSFNPYWQQRGRTFKDHDGYRTVLEHASWSSSEEP